MKKQTRWLDDELNKQRADEKRAELETQRRLRDASVVKSKGPDLLRSITEAVARVVETYGEKTKGDDRRRADFSLQPPGGFKLHKSHYPATSITCGLDFTTGQIHCERSLMPNSASSIQRESVDIGIAVDEHDDVMLIMDGRRITPDEAAEELLKPVLFPSG